MIPLDCTLTGIRDCMIVPFSQLDLERVNIDMRLSRDIQGPFGLQCLFLGTTGKNLKKPVYTTRITYA